MQDFYDTNIIPKILKIFKVKKAVISGIDDTDLIDNILNYDASFTQINTNETNCIKDNPLNLLPNLENYDAIFINDDSNWFTVFSELEIIKKTNEEFPLVFICNNNFPNKRRDSYLNPDNIPSKFRHKYTTELPVCHNNEKIIISDGKYHACEENTPRNGVLTVIEDFLDENSHIGMMKISFIKEISILYLKSQINQKRTSIIVKNIKNDKIDDINLSDKIIENQLLVSHINKNNLYNENLNDFEVELSRKDTIINDYENKIRTQNNEIKLKDTQLNGSEIDLSLKDSQIRNIESKLVNRDRRIIDLERQLKTSNNDLNTLTQEIDDKNAEIVNLENQLEITNNDLNSLNQEIDDKNAEIHNLENLVEITNNDLNSLTQHINEKDNELNELTINFSQKESQYADEINSLNSQLNQKNQDLNNNKKNIQQKDEQINSLKNELNLKENNFATRESELNNQINNNKKNIQQKDEQINSLKNELNLKENNFATRELELNNQINNNKQNIQQKDNQIRIQQRELDDNKTRINALEHSYTQQLSRMDNDKYCIHCFKEEISNNHTEINYLRNKTLTRSLLNPFAYVYIILKSKPSEIPINTKLYRALKDSNCFDIGFYLNNNKDLIKSKWCKYFSPELHYICNGFDENRTFNKKYFNRNSKKDLLNYILTCDK